MGVVLQILGLAITFTMAMEALRRFGIDVGWLNPLAFFHQRAWRKKVSTPPLYALDHPVDVVAVPALATVQTKGTGAVTVEQKAGVQALLRDRLALIKPHINPAQQQLMDAVDAYFAKKQAASGSWSSGT